MYAPSPQPRHLPPPCAQRHPGRVTRHSLGQLGLVEIKSGQTVSSSWFKPMERVAQALGPSRIGRRMMIYGGSEHQVRQGVEVVGFSAGALNAGTEESAGA